MSLLRDQDLIAGVQVQPPAVPYVAGLDLPANPYSKDSPVQGASIDLHIGDIYLPGKKKDEEGGVGNPKSEHSLQTGETAVVTTKETIHLPDTVAGFGFPPSRVSFKGLLMTNPGHVDPGYEGVMRFTVINMAKEVYHLGRGDRIVRLLLFRMDKAVQADWRKRNPEGSHPPSQSDINHLSKDFVDVERRAKRIAKEQGIKVGLVLTSVLALLGLLVQARLFYVQDVEDIKKRQEMLEHDLNNRINLEQKLKELDSRLKSLEREKSPSGEQLKSQSSRKNTTEIPGKHP